MAEVENTLRQRERDKLGMTEGRLTQMQHGDFSILFSVSANFSKSGFLQNSAKNSRKLGRQSGNADHGNSELE